MRANLLSQLHSLQYFQFTKKYIVGQFHFPDFRHSFKFMKGCCHEMNKLKMKSVVINHNKYVECKIKMEDNKLGLDFVTI